ncbi:MAG: AmmeMemoRadiSam system protein B [Acidimicrobiia bacterium]
MKTRQVRRPVAAGSFYPDDPTALQELVDELLRGSAPTGKRAPAPGALIVPHAGYRFSGSIAATAYALVAPVTRVVLFGPGHFVPLTGMAVPASAGWATPLGEVPIDDELRERAAAAGARIDDAPHELEHSLEVQLPFLQRVAGERFTVLPVAVGATGTDAVADLIDALDDEPDRLIVVSTDLSHYLDAETARTLDRRTADAVVERDPRAIRIEDACGVFALRGIVEHARRHDLAIRLLDLRNSADTAGDPWRVVGYGAFAVGAP